MSVFASFKISSRFSLSLIVSVARTRGAIYIRALFCVRALKLGLCAVKTVRGKKKRKEKERGDRNETKNNVVFSFEVTNASYITRFDFAPVVRYYYTETVTRRNCIGRVFVFRQYTFGMAASVVHMNDSSHVGHSEERSGLVFISQLYTRCAEPRNLAVVVAYCNAGRFSSELRYFKL